MTVEINPMTTVGEVSSTINSTLQGIQTHENTIVDLIQSLGIFYLFFLGINSRA